VRHGRRGFTLIEVIFAIAIFLLMGLMIAAVVPTAVRSARQGNTYALATSLVRHKIDQLQKAGYDKMNGPGLGQNDTDIVDGTPTNANANGTADITFNFATTDKLAQVFPSGATGTIRVKPYSPSVSGTTASVIQATVTVTWREAGRPVSSVSMTTLIPKASF